MAGSNNLGVADNEYIEAGKLIGDYGDELQAMMVKYCLCVRYIAENAIMDQRIKSKLSVLCREVNELREPLSDATNEAAKQCKKYVKDIDKADKFLY